jgi:hypothetical protein
MAGKFGKVEIRRFGNLLAADEAEAGGEVADEDLEVV